MTRERSQKGVLRAQGTTPIGPGPFSPVGIASQFYTICVVLQSFSNYLFILQLLQEIRLILLP